MISFECSEQNSLYEPFLMFAIETFIYRDMVVLETRGVTVEFNWLVVLILTSEQSPSREGRVRTIIVNLLGRGYYQQITKHLRINCYRNSLQFNPPINYMIRADTLYSV